jgi:hypothetical protein
LNRASLWEFAAAVKGWNACHGAEDEQPEPMSPEQFDRLVLLDDERMKRKANG